MNSLLLIGMLSVLVPSGPPVSWSFAAKPMDDGSSQVLLTATVDEGWHIYATELENDLGPIPTSIHFVASDEYTLVDGLVEPDAEEVYDQNFQMQVRYHSGKPVFIQRIKASSESAVVVHGEVEFMVCNDKTCLPPEVVTFAIELPKRDPKE